MKDKFIFALTTLACSCSQDPPSTEGYTAPLPIAATQPDPRPVATPQGLTNIVYTPIPSGFDFPAAEATLRDALKAGDVAALRRHAWMVFAGLTQPTRPNDPRSEALWETWYTNDQVFHDAASPQGMRTLQRKLTLPRQFMPKGPGASPQAAGESLLAFTLFNEEFKAHTHEHKLHLAKTLNDLNNSWPAGTPPADRKIPDYPPTAMSLKTSWKLVKRKGVTPLPIWDEQAPFAVAPSQPEWVWPRAVVVDPSRSVIPPDEHRNVTLGGKSFPNSHVVTLGSFYHFEVTAAEAARIESSVGAAVGDYMVLVGFHYTTKEIPNWVWGTLWWHDRPDAGPYAEGRLDEKYLAGPWRNYLLDVSYDMDLPRESNDTPNAVFNPWLEAGFDDGVNSNCMTCHQRAIRPSIHFEPVTRGPLAPNDPLFLDSTKLDFLWSVALEVPK